jgi:hypothetical protein
LLSNDGCCDIDIGAGSAVSGADAIGTLVLTCAHTARSSIENTASYTARNCCQDIEDDAFLGSNGLSLCSACNRRFYCNTPTHALTCTIQTGASAEESAQSYNTNPTLPENGDMLLEDHVLAVSLVVDDVSLYHLGMVAFQPTP